MVGWILAQKISPRKNLPQRPKGSQDLLLFRYPSQYSMAEFCTAKWLEVLVSQRSTKYNELVNHIQMLASEIIAFQQKIPSTWLDTLKKNTKAKENTLIETKLNRFHRDISDYSKGNIFSTKCKIPPPVPTSDTGVCPSPRKPITGNNPQRGNLPLQRASSKNGQKIQHRFQVPLKNVCLTKTQPRYLLSLTTACPQLMSRPTYLLLHLKTAPLLTYPLTLLPPVLMCLYPLSHPRVALPLPCLTLQILHYPLEVTIIQITPFPLLLLTS